MSVGPSSHVHGLFIYYCWSALNVVRRVYFCPSVGCGGADWIDLAQDRDGWRAVVYTVMNLRVP